MARTKSCRHLNILFHPQNFLLILPLVVLSLLLAILHPLIRVLYLN
jgi:hypothetical protein